VHVPARPPRPRVWAAWAVHLFTASGLVAGFAALLAVLDGDPRACFLWLAAALVIDGVDGTFARRAAVKDVLPHFDGAVLDLVIDYLTYVVVPALFLLRLGMLPEPFAFPLAAYVLVTSLYCFCNVHMKSADHYFVGFPAVWNLVAFYLWVLHSSPAVNAAVVLVLGALTPTPIKFLHPFRERRLLPYTLVAAAAWGISGVALILLHPARPPVAFVIWLLATAYYVAVCAWRTLRGPLHETARAAAP
jgi:phosphatidylcholine synthase